MCVCVKCFCEMCVFVLNVFGRFVCMFVLNVL